MTELVRKKKETKKSRTKVGTDHEREREIMLVEDNWLTHKTQNAHGWEKNKDIFNMFDILAFKKNRTKLSQVKTTNLQGCIEKIRQWILKNKDRLPDNLEIEVALKKYATKRKIERWIIYDIPIDENMPVTKYTR